MQEEQQPAEKPPRKRDRLKDLITLSSNAKAIVAGLAALAGTALAIVKILEDDPKPTPKADVTEVTPIGTRTGGTTGGTTGTTGGNTGGTTGTTTGGLTGFRVISVMTRVDPFHGDVACPVALTFRSRINALGGAGTVTYRWLRSDGASAPIQTVRFDDSGSKDVETTWTRGGGPGEVIQGWQAVEILEPARGPTPQRAIFDVKCNS